MLGRPINPGLHSVQEIDAVELLDEVYDETSGLATKPESTWFVQVEPGNVKALSAEQLRDFYRLGVINRQTYLWQPEAKQWVPLSTFVGEEQPVSTTSTSDDDWDVLMGPGDVRHVSIEQLDDFYRLGVIDGTTLVWQAGMTAWTKLADLVGEEDDVEEIWYAQMPSGEVKQLTLEQLDDFYRVDVISEQTPIWKEGMNQWLPLGMAAGIAEASPLPVVQSPVRVAPQPTGTSVPTPTKVAPPASKVAAIAPAAVTVAPVPVLSAPPMVTTIAPPQPASAGGKWLVRLCIAAGVFAALLRNDVLFSAAQAARQQSGYTQLEQQSLGGPGFGTLRAVEQLVAETGGDLAPVKLPWLVQESRAHAAKEAAAARSNVPASQPEVHAQTPAIAAAVTAKPEAKALASVPTAKTVAAANVAAATQSTLGSKKPTKAKATSRASVSRKAGSKGKGGVFSSKGDAYDPLNGAM
jgi:hypothetical protein